MQNSDHSYHSMEREVKIFETFLALNHHKADATEEPVVHVAFHKQDCLSPGMELIRFRREDILEELDKESPLVQQLLRQVSTYECHRQCIIALVFDAKTVLSEVFHRTSK